MARQIASGWRDSVSARVAMIVGIVCVTAIAFAVPALADDDSGSSGGTGATHSGTDRGTADGTTSDRDKAADDDNTDNTDNATDDDNGGGGGGGNRDDSGRGKNVKKADPNLVKGTPCTKTARACVDLKSQQAWLINTAGAVTRGPVKVSSGGPGEETPTGTFAVQWKDKNHKSAEYKEPNGQPAPMPYSVFFANGGVAFHGGSLTRASAGCVHLDDDDAIVFYNTLKLGDQVQVH